MSAPKVTNVKRRKGVADQYSVSADVAYPGEGGYVVTFISSGHGGPIVMRTERGVETFVHSAVLDRLGHTLTPQWVRDFFAA